MEQNELIRRTISLCPECLQNIPAEVIWEKNTNRVMMKKTCAEHGDFEDRLSSNPEEYMWRGKYIDEIGSIEGNITAPTNDFIRENELGCPYNCGLCNQHISAPNIAIVDLTNRCNLRCPVCFANSAASGYIYEPTFEELRQIFTHFRSIKPIGPVSLQLSGGEPTLRNDLFDIIRMGRDIGFVHIMLTTNGIKLAKSVEYCRQLKEAGVDAVYLSFDGTEPETWKKMRGVDLSKIKMKVLDNCREAGLDGVGLIPTLVRGVNDHEIGNVLDVAKEYQDIVSAVIFQPVSLTGRISIEDLNQMRYTTSDLKDAINKYSGGLIKKFYPIATASKLTRLLPWFDNEQQFGTTSHDDCGFATFCIVDRETKEWKPLENFVDVDGLLKFTNETFDVVMKRKIPKPTKIFKINTSKLPKIFQKIAEFTDDMTDLAYRGAMKSYYMAGAVKFFKGDLNFIIKNKDTFFNFIKLMWAPGLGRVKDFMLSGNIMISCMHFQDSYNFDLDRVKRCLVHYGVIDPDDPNKVLQIPFCSYNTLHREKIERKLAKRKEERTTEQIDQEVKILVEQLGKN